MGKKRARRDPDAPMPEMKDQGGLAAVARAMAKQRAAAGPGAPSGDERAKAGNEAKRAKKDRSRAKEERK